MANEIRFAGVNQSQGRFSGKSIRLIIWYYSNGFTRYIDGVWIVKITKIKKMKSENRNSVYIDTGYIGWILEKMKRAIGRQKKKLVSL